MTTSTSDGGARRAHAAAVALWLALIVLALVRAGLAFVPSMRFWGLNLLRFVSPAAGWTMWAVAAIALVPAIARGALPGLDLFGRTIERRPAIAYAVWGVGGAALAWTFPDHLRFVGDYLLRFGTAERALKPSGLFPQALPLDVLLHYSLPRWLDAAFGMDVNLAGRVLGAVEAGLLGVLAVAFARALALKGALADAAATLVFFGGYLALLTGYGKAITEVSLLTVAVAVLALRAGRDGSSVLPLGLCCAAGFVLHRSTLALVPAAAVAWIAALRSGAAPRSGGGPRPLARPAVWLAAAVPVAALAAMLPRMIATFGSMDRVHFTSAEVTRQGGLLAATFSLAHLADVLNVATLLSPLAIVIPVLAAAWRPQGETAAREAGVLLAVAAPWLGFLLLVHPPQGIFRDWDDFAAAGVSLSMLAAWLCTRTLERAPRWLWLCAPLTLGVMAPTAQWLVHEADLEGGLGRIAAYLNEPPPRSDEERARIWDFLGIRYAQLDRWDRSAAAMARAARYAPSPRVLLQWASAEQTRGADREAQAVYRRLVAIAPDEPRGWFGLADVSHRLGDWAEVRRGARELLRLRPGDPQALEIMALADRMDSTGVAKAR